MPKSVKKQTYSFFSLGSVDRASLYNLVKENNLVHDLFLAYFVNLVEPWPWPNQFHSVLHTSQLYRITSTTCRINTDVPPDDGPGEV
jgi:hypothetical protein